MLPSPFLFFFPIIFEALGDLGVNQHPKWYNGKNQCWAVLDFYEEAWVPVLEITPSLVNYPYSRLFPAKKHISKNSGSGSGFGSWRGALNCAHWMW
jgi:hypothetical protein